MSTSLVRCELREGGIAVLWLDRAERGNALTPALERELRDAVERLGRDDAVNAIVLTGNGRHFCTGADLALLAVAAARDHVPYDAELQTRLLYLTRTPKPVVCAVQGCAYGAGMVLALYCDVRFAAANCMFRAPFAELGLVAEMGIAWHLPRLVGLGRSLEWLLGGARIDAEAAFRAGLVNRVLPDEGFVDAAVAATRELFDGRSRSAMAAIKSQLWSAYDRSLAADTLLAGQQTAQALNGADFRERAARLAAERLRP